MRVPCLNVTAGATAVAGFALLCRLKRCGLNDFAPLVDVVAVPCAVDMLRLVAPRSPGPPMLRVIPLSCLPAGSVAGPPKLFVVVCGLLGYVDRPMPTPVGRPAGVTACCCGPRPDGTAWGAFPCCEVCTDCPFFFAGGLPSGPCPYATEVSARQLIK